MGKLARQALLEKDGRYESEGAGLSHDILSLEHLRYRFGGDPSPDGRSLLCPGPDHSAADRSMSITIDPSAPDGVLINSFSPRTSAAECWEYFWKTLQPDIDAAMAATLRASGNPEDGTGQVAMLPRPVAPPQRDMAERISPCQIEMGWLLRPQRPSVGLSRIASPSCSWTGAHAVSPIRELAEPDWS
jgi:hypothetical protein